MPLRARILAILEDASDARIPVEASMPDSLIAIAGERFPEDEVLHVIRAWAYEVPMEKLTPSGFKSWLIDKGEE
ncbi:MAG: hypothetical protein ABSG29_09680 [Steroidobacteraceae bacterium]|jgi:hypothetical protein